MTLSSPVLTTKAINLNIMRIKLSNSLIVEFYPSVFALLDIAEIMTELSTSIMQNNTLEGKLIIVSITLPFLFVKSIVIDVQVVREFKSRVYLLILEFIVVEANTLEVDNEVVRYLCQQTTFSHICFFLAGVTLIV